MTALANAPAHWTRTTLGEVAQVRLGRQRSPKNHAGDQMRPYLRAANVDWYSLRLNDIAEMNVTDAEMETYSLRKGDVLVVEGSGSASEVGKCVVVPEAYEGHAFQNTLIRLRPNVDVDSRWLMYRVNAEAELGGFLAHARGSGIFHLGSKRTGQWPISLPPLEEQREIADAVSKSLTRVGHVAASLAELPPRRVILEKAQVQRVLDGLHRPRMVSWGDVGVTLSGRAFPSTDYTTQGHRLVRPGNLSVDGTVVWGESRTTHLPIKYGYEYPSHLLRGPVLLMNLTAQSLADEFLGRVCLAGDDDRFLLNQRIAALSSEDASLEYLFWVFRSPAFRAFISRKNTGSTIQHISTRHLEEFKFPLPAEEVQERVVNALRAFTRLAGRFDEQVHRVCSRSSTLRRSILKAAFEGRLQQARASAAHWST